MFNDKIKIVITGAESTGKTTLTKQLAEYYKTIWLPEYARSYVEKLDRPYNYNDVIHITEKQIELENVFIQKAKQILFVDTSFIILKIWFEEVYKKTPDWLEDEIIKNKADLYLLCKPDLEWEFDSVRENGGEKRLYLSERYKKELEFHNFNFVEINGLGKKRFENAKTKLDLFLSKTNNKIINIYQK